MSMLGARSARRSHVNVGLPAAAGILQTKLWLWARRVWGLAAADAFGPGSASLCGVSPDSDVSQDSDPMSLGTIMVMIPSKLLPSTWAVSLSVCQARATRSTFASARQTVFRHVFPHAGDADSF